MSLPEAKKFWEHGEVAPVLALHRAWLDPGRAAELRICETVSLMLTVGAGYSATCQLVSQELA